MAHRDPLAPKVDEWERIMDFQKTANEAIEDRRLRKVKGEKTTLRGYLDEQTSIRRERRSQLPQMQRLEREREELEYRAWVQDEQQKQIKIKAKVMEEKAMRLAQIEARRTVLSTEKAARLAEERLETLRTKQEIQADHVKAETQKAEEKARLAAYQLEVKEQMRVDLIAKGGRLEEEKRIAVEYEKEEIKKEQMRKGYFISKQTGNDKMVDRIDKMVLAKERAERAREERLLVEKVAAEDAAYSAMLAAREAKRTADNKERLEVLAQQIEEKKRRKAAEKAEDMRHAADMKAMKEAYDLREKNEQAAQRAKIGQYKDILNGQKEEIEANRKVFFMSDTEKLLNAPLIGLVNTGMPGGKLPEAAVKRFSAVI